MWQFFFDEMWYRAQIENQTSIDNFVFEKLKIEITQTFLEITCCKPFYLLPLCLYNYTGRRRRRSDQMPLNIIMESIIPGMFPKAVTQHFCLQLFTWTSQVVVVECFWCILKNKRFMDMNESHTQHVSLSLTINFTGTALSC